MKKIKQLTIVTTLTFAAISVFAGQGYFVTLANKTNNVVTTSVSNINCMYDADRLNLTIMPHSTIDSVYIEEKSSGSCVFRLFEPHQFTLNFAENNGRTASIEFTGSDVGSKYTTDAYLYAYSGWNNYSSNGNFAYVASIAGGEQYHVKINIVP